VIDHHGDLGVAWRLARQLAARGHAARLVADDLRALAWMAPAPRTGASARVDVQPWQQVQAEAAPEVGDLVIEAFGCDPPPNVVAAMAAKAARGEPPAWINLEYLSAEDWVERAHGLPSPVASGPGAGLVKRFHFPGFTPATGGLLREPDLQARQAAFDAAAWLGAAGVRRAPGDAVVAIYAYDATALPALLEAVLPPPARVHLLVPGGAAARPALPVLPERVQVHALAFLAHDDFDHLLWAADLNLVRGEDSFVRAVHAARPFVWQPYPQHDGAHVEKLEAFLGHLAPPAGVAALFRRFSGVATAADLAAPPPDRAAWVACCEGFRQRQRAQPDLASTLLEAAGQMLAASRRRAPRR
jgi:uncharacterized repeat protein (TIGR03837 family)